MALLLGGWTQDWVYLVQPLGYDWNQNRKSKKHSQSFDTTKARDTVWAPVLSEAFLSVLFLCVNRVRHWSDKCDYKINLNKH